MTFTDYMHAHLLVCTVVWKYFVSKKILWAIKFTKIIYTKILNMNNNNEVSLCNCNIILENYVSMYINLKRGGSSFFSEQWLY